MAHQTVDVELHDVKPGDLADHVDRKLDPRRVTKVEGDRVWLWFIVSDGGPFPLTNYTYTRDVSEGQS